MTKARELLAELKAGLERIYGERLRGLYLYGSYARNEQQPESDFDVLIVLDQVPHYSGELERTGYLASELSIKYGVSVSRVFVAEPDWEAAESMFLRSAREEAIAA